MFSMLAACGHGSVLLWKCYCDTLCTSGFVDDIMAAWLITCRIWQAWQLRFQPNFAMEKDKQVLIVSCTLAGGREVGAKSAINNCLFVSVEGLTEFVRRLQSGTLTTHGKKSSSQGRQSLVKVW